MCVCVRAGNISWKSVFSSPLAVPLPSKEFSVICQSEIKVPDQEWLGQGHWGTAGGKRDWGLGEEAHDGALILFKGAEGCG